MRIAQKGFTLIELLVVIVVIAVLVAVTATMYQNAQVQARDTQIKDAADKFADAIMLWSANHNGAIPSGGSATAGTNGLNAQSDNCITGTIGWQGYRVIDIAATYQCTIGDVMVASGYLPAEMFDKLPINTIALSLSNRRVFMIYGCPSNTSYRILMYTLEDPTAGDTSNYNQIHTNCSTSAGDLTNYQNYGMRAAILLKFA